MKDIRKRFVEEVVKRELATVEEAVAYVVFAAFDSNEDYWSVLGDSNIGLEKAVEVFEAWKAQF